jgi:hypothetical protein
MSRPFRIAVLDSGVHLAHPHIGGVIGGRDCTGAIGAETAFPECCVDRLGHGTAVAALIHHLAPEAQMLAVRIFHRQLATSLPVVMRAIEWSLEQEIDLLNLSFGTANLAHKSAFESAITEARRRGVLVVSAWESMGQRVMPGSLEGAMGVVADSDCPVGMYRVLDDERGVRFAAAPYPRTIPGVPREDNLSGVSFAAASLSGQIAGLWQRYGTQTDWRAFLRQHAPGADVSC